MLRRRSCRHRRPFRSSVKLQTAKNRSTSKWSPVKKGRTRGRNRRSPSRSPRNARDGAPALQEKATSRTRTPGGPILAIAGWPSLCSPAERPSKAYPTPRSGVFSIEEGNRGCRNVSAEGCPFRGYAGDAFCAQMLCHGPIRLSCKKALQRQKSRSFDSNQSSQTEPV